MGIKVVFISNYLTIHQIAICREFYKRNDVSFKFVSSFKPYGDKAKYNSFENEPFVIRAYSSKAEKKTAIDYINDADVIIFGSGDLSLIKNRKKLIFFYSEHLSKTKITLLRKIHLRMIYKKYVNSYLLCASCYSCRDFNSIGLFLNRCFYYGYFPLLTDCSKKNRNDTIINILWAGRELPLKRPEYAFYAAEYLYEKRIQYRITIVSSTERIMKDLIIKYSTEPWYRNIQILMPMDNALLREIMIESDIFILSSDQNEGWGVVVNEAMNAGCCPIVSVHAGCSRSLIQDGYNGYLFDKKNEFIDKLAQSITDLAFKSIGQKASETIKETWNAKNAVNNLCDVFKLVLNHQDIPNSLINNGPGTKIV